MLSVPRIVIAAAASGQGKTTVAVGLMAALTRMGQQVAPAKVGPDFIDPGYHALATGRAGRNLDPWLCGEDAILPLLAHGHLSPQPAALSIIEGVMGLYDGRIGTDGYASTAHIAALTATPVILIVDISAAARTIAATVHGLATYQGSITVAGVILNKSGSQRHADEVRRNVEAAGYPVLGVLPRDAGVSAPSRHLGLVPVAERHDAASALDLLAEQTAAYVDLAAVTQIAGTAADLDTTPWEPPISHRQNRPVVAIAGGRAFTFQYAETEEMLRAQGMDPVIFDPALDGALPVGAAALYFGGGFPELHAAELAGNRTLQKQIRDAVHSGMPTLAECAGMLYLSQAVDGHEFVGAINARAAMGPRLTLQYHQAQLATDSVLGPAGAGVRSHEFHRTRIAPAYGPDPAWRIGQQSAGFALDPAGTGRATLHASYLHVHWAGAPTLAGNFCDAAAQYADAPSRNPGAQAPVPQALTSPEPTSQPVRVDAPSVPGSAAAELGSLDHHGDAEATSGMIDLAVNVRSTAPPTWLAQRLISTVSQVGPYPSSVAARTAIARRHGIDDDMVLPTNGASEAFTLIARGLPARRVVVVHPQFTEPESAMRRADRAPERVLLGAPDGFVLHASAVPDEADLVFVGNPTNPTGVLHPRGALEALVRPGRIVVIDEAFIDAVAAGQHSLISPDMSGIVVVRSLTKTWSVAGIRAGYVVADPSIIAMLAHHQPQWSVSTFGAVVMEQTASPRAIAEADADAITLQRWRDVLVEGLRALGLRPVPGQAPFVLVRVGAGVHHALRGRGIAVRSCDSFPGLDNSWIRIAVREEKTIEAFLNVLSQVVRMEQTV